MGGCAFIVCIAGYQPSSLDKFDLSHAQLAATGDAGGKPFIIIDEECYGGVLEQGDWSGRPGYSQIADCVTGIGKLACLWTRHSHHSLPPRNRVLHCYSICGICSHWSCPPCGCLGDRDYMFASSNMFVRRLTATAKANASARHTMLSMGLVSIIGPSTRTHFFNCWSISSRLIHHTRGRITADYYSTIH